MAEVACYEENYTYDDYLGFPHDAKSRCELIDGKIYMMASPSYRHQATVGELYGQLREFFKDKPCRVVVAPFDVRLFSKENDSDTTVVQPDIMVVCDAPKLEDGQSCMGAPDFIIEVLSRRTRSYDLLMKRAKYEKAGVKEYWAVGTDAVFKYVLVDGRYVETICTMSIEPIDIPVDLFDGCVLRFDPNLE